MRGERVVDGRVSARAGILLGAVAGVAAGLVFATLHAFIIVPIWDRMAGGLVHGAIAGAVVGWAYTELYPDQPRARPAAAAVAGARFGALLWLVVAPVSAADAILRAAGILPRYELIGVVIAVLLSVAAGSLLGWQRTKRRRGAIAGAAAALLLTTAMAGPVPIANNPRSFGIFLAVLPACIVAGAVLGAALSRPLFFTRVAQR